ncbi:hypothetical protein [Brevundimonas sp. R86498]|uniref:hypothetical protein n=1 Tax=Brevundimonas sp. R86498 TaxID=3093845 RepID=UPI0037CB70CB
MAIDPIWLPHIAGIIGGGTITAIWLWLARGWKKDMAREQAIRDEWRRTHPAE